MIVSRILSWIPRYLANYRGRESWSWYIFTFPNRPVNLLWTIHILHGWPRTVGWCANHDKHDRGRAIVERLNGGIEGYDVDFHYSLIKKTVDNEKAQKRAALGADRGVLKGLWDCREVFTGANGVSNYSILLWRCITNTLHSSVLWWHFIQRLSNRCLVLRSWVMLNITRVITHFWTLALQLLKLLCPSSRFLRPFRLFSPTRVSPFCIIICRFLADET